MQKFYKKKNTEAFRFDVRSAKNKKIRRQIPVGPPRRDGNDNNSKFIFSSRLNIIIKILIRRWIYLNL